MTKMPDSAPPVPRPARDLADVADVRAVWLGAERAREALPPPPVAPWSGDVDAFRTAGWAFVDALTAPRDGRVARVLVEEGERLLLWEGLLVVKLRDDVGRDDAARIFEQAGYSVRGRLPMAPNLFRVASADGNPLAAESALTRVPEVDFVEAELLEVMAAR
jgi:hypothetical protein